MIDHPAAIREAAHIERRKMQCIGTRETLAKAQRVIDHYRVALAQIQRTTRDSETAEYAIDMLQEAATIQMGE